VKLRVKGKTLTLKGENRKLIIHREDVGCRYCVSDTGAVGVRVCKSCWKTYPMLYKFVIK
jgi:hypothetical protein